MNSVAIYPRDSITFAREPVRVVPSVRRWTQPVSADLNGVEVLELEGPEAWALWDSVVAEHDKK